MRPWQRPLRAIHLVALSLFLFALVPPTGAGAQAADASPALGLTVTPAVAMGGAWRHLPYPYAVFTGAELEVVRGPLAVTLDVAGWAFLVGCIWAPCGERVVTGVLGVRYALPVTSDRLRPYVGGGGGLVRSNTGAVGVVGLLRTGIDIGLSRHTALRVDARYQPMRIEEHSGPFDHEWVSVEHLFMLVLGLRLAPFPG